MAEGTDWSFFDIPARAVQDNLGAMSSRADAALAVANNVIGQLQGIKFDPEPAPPNPPPLDLKVPVPVVPTIGDYTRFGHPHDYNEPAFEDLWDKIGLSSSDFVLEIKDFDPKTPPLHFPDDPKPLDTSGKPERPTVDTDIPIPGAPELVMPTLDELAQIVIPDFAFPTLPTFAEVAPQFAGTAPNTNVVWSEPVYASAVESDLVLRVRAMLAGGTGLPANVQQALFDQARSHVAQTALEAEQGAFDSFAGKNFSMPPGMLAEAVRRAQEKSRLEQNAQERELFAKAAQWEIENLRQAVTQGMGYETLLRNQFNNVATRSFELAKFRVESDIKLYDADVTLFNVRNQQHATLSQVFKIRLDGVLETFKTQVQAATSRADIGAKYNENLIRAFVGRFEGIKAAVELYKGAMQGAQTRASIVKEIYGAYGEDVKAYAEKITAEKERFTAYYERVRAEAEKSKSLEYEARAYEATLRGSEAKANLKKSYVEARVSALRESVAQFLSRIQSEREVVSASVQAIQANASAFSADTSRYTAEIQGVNESVRTDLMVHEQDTRNRLALWETSVKEYDAKLGRMIEEAKIVLGGLDAAARTSSMLAAGAMSAIHVQAGMSASGGASSTSAYNVSVARQGADVA